MRTIRKNTKILIQGAILTMLILQYSAVFAQANDYVPLAPLPGTMGNCVQANGCSTNLSTYLPGIFKLLIGIGAVAAFVVITLYGFEYMLTDSLNTKLKAHEMLENALWGLGLIIFAYVILNTINPALLNGSLNIQAPTVTTQAGITTVPGPTGQFNYTNSAGTAVGYNPCSNCVSLSSLQLNNNVPGTINGQAPKINNIIGAKLKTLQNSVPDMRVTEAWPPTVNHKASCQTDGTCVDANISNSTPTNIKNFISQASSANLQAVYEVPTKAQATSLLVSTGLSPSQIIVVPYITAPHFSIYNR